MNPRDLQDQQIREEINKSFKRIKNLYNNPDTVDQAYLSLVALHQRILNTPDNTVHVEEFDRHLFDLRSTVMSTVRFEEKGFPGRETIILQMLRDIETLKMGEVDSAVGKTVVPPEPIVNIEPELPANLETHEQSAAQLEVVNPIIHDDKEKQEDTGSRDDTQNEDLVAVPKEPDTIAEHIQAFDELQIKKNRLLGLPDETKYDDHIIKAMTQKLINSVGEDYENNVDKYNLVTDLYVLNVMMKEHAGTIKDKLGTKELNLQRYEKKELTEVDREDKERFSAAIDLLRDQYSSLIPILMRPKQDEKGGYYFPVDKVINNIKIPKHKDILINMRKNNRTAYEVSKPSPGQSEAPKITLSERWGRFKKTFRNQDGTINKAKVAKTVIFGSLIVIGVAAMIAAIAMSGGALAVPVAAILVAGAIVASTGAVGVQRQIHTPSDNIKNAAAFVAEFDKPSPSQDKPQPSRKRGRSTTALAISQMEPDVEMRHMPTQKRPNSMLEQPIQHPLKTSTQNDSLAPKDSFVSLNDDTNQTNKKRNK